MPNKIIDKDFSDDLSFMYGILIATGACVAILVSVIRLRRKNIPVLDIINVIYISVPIAFFGASLIGKLDTGKQDSWHIWEYFYFWDPGMSIFGGMICGFGSAFIFLQKKGRVNKISVLVYADCILPNVLLAQSIGRWGNLFNHEILGKSTNIENWKWLPKFIWSRFFYISNPATGKRYDVVEYRVPLCLVESILTLTLFFIIIFIVPLLFNLISSKPWNVDKKAFPIKKYAIKKEELKFVQTQLAIDEIKYNGKVYYSRKNAWRKAYYWYEPNAIEVSDAQKEYDKIKNVLASKGKSKWKSIWMSNSKKMYNLNNTGNYTIMHCGVQGSLYFIGYVLIRIILDFSERSEYEMTIRNIPGNALFLVVMLILSISFLVIVQFIAPYKWREAEWLYEKSY
ncbi:prolipoprotein diacylglyceryl transferase [Spiroplasma endosymbiont of Crioceris asparagi]|uniref:prolipoprotein diacylglyceryl transferase n=1 Tax=Spiroplasma endosymbiont of Crioceris asparagi TaxID=3066286 RepID=UPI0030CD9828